MMGNGPADDSSLPANWTAAQGGCGDCTNADPAHAERMAAHDAKRLAPSFSTKTVVDQYIYLTGQAGAAYDPVSGSNDNGLEVRQVLDYRQKQGYADDQGNRYKIGTYISIEPGNWQHLRECCWLFEVVTVGFQVPQSAMDQFNSGQTWSVVPGMMSNVVGGHDVPVVGHPGGGYWTCITWAQRQVMTYAFLVATCDEAWTYIDPERYAAVTGKEYTGYKDADLEAYITNLAQGTGG
jgi:hypothetical protein